MGCKSYKQPSFIIYRKNLFISRKDVAILKFGVCPSIRTAHSIINSKKESKKLITVPRYIGCFGWNSDGAFFGVCVTMHLLMGYSFNDLKNIKFSLLRRYF